MYLRSNINESYLSEKWKRIHIWSFSYRVPLHYSLHDPYTTKTLSCTKNLSKIFIYIHSIKDNRKISFVYILIIYIGTLIKILLIYLILISRNFKCFRGFSYLHTSRSLLFKSKREILLLFSLVTFGHRIHHFNNNPSPVTPCTFSVPKEGFETSLLLFQCTTTEVRS